MSEYLMTADAVIVTGPEFWDETNGPRPQEQVDSFARALQMVRDGIATLNANPGELSELVEGGTLAPASLAQLLMSALPVPGDARMNSNAKSYWMEVATYMGPNWIAEMRRVAAFMDKVDQF